MESFSTSISSLEKKVIQLIEMHSQSQKENKSLKASNQQLLVDKENQENKITQLSEQLKTLKLAQSLAGSGDQDTRQVKVKINEYIKEIDKCLALLNN